MTECDDKSKIRGTVSKAAALFKALRKPDGIPWGDTSYLLEKEDVQKLPRSHLRHHLAARNESTKGSARALSAQLQLSLKHEIEEKKRREENERKRINRLQDLEKKGAIYSVGSNHRGQLGLGDLDHRTKFNVIPETRGEGFTKVSTRNDVVFAITTDYKVFSWGGGGMGPMAIECKQKRSNFESPQNVELLEEEDITNISIGLNHACAISESMVGYSWGSGESGCLGSTNHDGGGTGYSTHPDLISFPMKNGFREFIQTIECGEMHCCALSSMGEIYTWGHAANGRLGVIGGTSKIIRIPRIINISVQIKMVSCGAEHTMAASCSNIYSWGANDGGRLGLGDLANRSTPSIIESLQGLHIIDISCGTWHSACIAAAPMMKSSGWLYTWGSGYSGQLALKDTTNSMVPTIVPFFCDNHITLSTIVCGSHHNAVLTPGNDMFTWGSNENGCLGHDIEEVFVSFTSKPGYCNFGTIIDGFSIGRPQSVAIGKGYTIVCTSRYNDEEDDET